MFFLLCSNVEAQITYSLKSDKDKYSYAELIEMEFQIRNDSHMDTTIWWKGCWPLIFYNEIPIWSECSLNDFELTIKAQHSISYFYEYDPQFVGIPDDTTTHVFKAFFQDRYDSVSVDAPYYRGGVIQLSFETDYDDSLKTLREELASEILRRTVFSAIDKIEEVWLIKGFDVDSLIAVHSEDRRIDRILEARILPQKRTVVSTEETPILPQPSFTVYPNPANPQTTVQLTIQETQPVTIRIVDINGRIIQNKYYGILISGNYNFPINLMNLSSGNYLITVSTNKNHRTQKITILK